MRFVSSKAVSDTFSELVKRFSYPNQEMLRIAKFLARCGYGSRRVCETIVVAGDVSVNGVLVDNCATHVDTLKDQVCVKGETVFYPRTLKLWRYYKPVGVLCTHYDPQGRPTMVEATQAAGLGYVMSIGRLDINSEGLLLFTNKQKIPITT